MKTSNGWVLGLNLHHDASACLVRNGQPVVAVAQERLSRRKHATFVRNNVVDYCLRAAGITAGDLDLVVLSSIFLPTHLGEDESFLWAWYEGVVQREFGEPFPLARSGAPVRALSNHLAHAYAAFGSTSWSEAAVLVVDWAGTARVDLTDPVERQHCQKSGSPFERERVSMYHFSDGGFEIVEKQFSCDVEEHNPYRLPVALSDGIGGLYETVGRFLFRKSFNGGKVMGLASYGDPPEELLADQQNGQFLLRHKWLRELVGQRVPPKDPIEFAGLAAAAQATVEKLVLDLATGLQAATGSRRLAYGGGVALNCVLNTRLEREKVFEEIFILPSSGDSGAALGAALYGSALLGQRWQHEYRSDYLGRRYPRSEIETTLRAAEPLVTWMAQDEKALVSRIALQLSEGKVVGWFQGSSEFGPRALGNRSILADPRRPDMKDLLNSKVKHREEFRPFAPVVLAHRVTDVFGAERERPFMLYVEDVRPEWRARIPSATHVDGLARVQTVTHDSNPRLFALIAAFEELTGIPVLINTSLNIAEEPIVERPEEALALLLRDELDVLVLDDMVAVSTPLGLSSPEVADWIPHWANGSTFVQLARPKAGSFSTVDGPFVIPPGSTMNDASVPVPLELTQLVDGQRTLGRILADAPPSHRSLWESAVRDCFRTGALRLVRRADDPEPSRV